VTFMLQSEKELIPDFSTWYAGRQQAMRLDPTMKWLVDTRNQVVKAGDLAAHSIARISLVESWANETPLDLDVNPQWTTASIARQVRDFRAAFGEADDSVAVVERRWILDSLPNEEVLAALAHCFAALYAVVDEAHQLCGSQLPAEQSVRPQPSGSHPIAPECMLASREARTERFRVATGQKLALGSESFRIIRTPAELERLAERYALKDLKLPAGSGFPHTADELFDLAEYFLEIAKRYLIVDGHVAMVLHRFGEGDAHHMRHIAAEDRSDYFILFREVAKEVEQAGWTHLLLVSEGWTAKPEELRTDMRGVVDVPTRGEAVQISAAHCDGSTRTLLAPFVRRPEILFGETIVAASIPGQARFLNPVWAVWDKHLR
jgi:hypothetical protein